MPQTYGHIKYAIDVSAHEKALVLRTYIESKIIASEVLVIDKGVKNKDGYPQIYFDFQYWTGFVKRIYARPTYPPLDHIKYGPGGRNEQSGKKTQGQTRPQIPPPTKRKPPKEYS